MLSAIKKAGPQTSQFLGSLVEVSSPRGLAPTQMVNAQTIVKSGQPTSGASGQPTSGAFSIYTPYTDPIIWAKH